jgi:hypothetical protein
MPGLVPGIHVLPQSIKEDVDGRDICAKTRFALQPGHDGVLTTRARAAIVPSW